MNFGPMEYNTLINNIYKVIKVTIILAKEHSRNLAEVFILQFVDIISVDNPDKFIMDHDANPVNSLFIGIYVDRNKTNLACMILLECGCNLIKLGEILSLPFLYNMLNLIINTRRVSYGKCYNPSIDYKTKEFVHLTHFSRYELFL